MVLSAVVLALRLRPDVARWVWIALLAIGVANAFVLNTRSHNLIHSNLVHYFLGAKYAVPYRAFYATYNAALEKPQIGMRDLEHLDRAVRSTPNAQRAYYIDLMRADGVEFDALAPLPELLERAQQAGALARESQHILSENLPASQIDDYRRDVRLADAAVFGREITLDAGFNGSPFYALVRHADPTLYRPIGDATAWANLIWQCFAVLMLAWLTGLALGLGVCSRLAMAALVFASWDFIAYAFPGLIFAGLWLPVAVALYAMSRRAALPAGGAIAWAGLIKIFPFVLLLPAGIRIVRTMMERVRGRASGGQTGYWVKIVTSCILATGVLAVAATLSGRSWVGFFDKIVTQFSSKGIAGNNVSLSAALSAIGIEGSPLPTVLSVVSLAVLAAMFWRGKNEDIAKTLPRRSLVLLTATGWVAHKWLNYYSVAALLLLPLLVRRHRIGATAAAAAMALAYLLPDFDDPAFAGNPALRLLKLAPYLLVPAWLVYLEFKDSGTSKRLGRLAAITCAVCVLLVAGEAWRLHTARNLVRTGHAYIQKGDGQNAIKVYKKLARISPGNDDAYTGQAVSYVLLKDIVNAERNFERANELAPDDAEARHNYGRFLGMTGRADEAAGAFEASLEIEPYDVTVMLDLARARLQQKDKAAALSILSRARELRPSNEPVHELLEQLQNQAP